MCINVFGVEETSVFQDEGFVFIFGLQTSNNQKSKLIITSYRTQECIMSETQHNTHT